MLPTQIASWFLAASLLLADAPVAHAQLGGLIKKKVSEAVKGPDKAQDQAKAADAPTDGSKLGFKLTGAVLDAFESGLTVELRERDAFRKLVSTLKTPKQYEQCKTDALKNPEGQKMGEDYLAALTRLGDASPGMKAEQIMKETQDIAEKLARQSDALFLKYCGEDPSPMINSQRQAFEKAAYAGAMEFGKVFNKPDSISDDQRMHRYAVLKEWVLPFCQMSDESQREAARTGLKLPGSGTGIYWVYTKDESTLLIDVCVGDKRAIAKLLRQFQIE